MLENILAGLSGVLTIDSLIAMVIGLAVGLSFGALPGLNSTIGITLLLPVTFTLSPAPAMLMLLGVYCGATYAGSISAILIKTPGTPAAAATVLDGYPMTQQGKAPRALMIALKASVVGGLISGVCLLFLAPQVAKVALKFGSPEYFTLTIFGLSIIASVSGNNIFKGLAMGFFGLLVKCIGVDPQQGIYRLTFGSQVLTRGVDLVPALIGLFAVSELFTQCEKKIAHLQAPPNVTIKHAFSWKELFSFKFTVLRSAIMGIIVGACPGTGSAIASFLSYGTAKNTSKHPEEYGKGSSEGLVASETANNAVTGATLIPMLTLGIPGDGVTAILMGALTIQGLSPGSQLFTKYAPMTYCVLVGFVVIQILMYFMGIGSIKLFSYLTKIPYYILMPMVFVFCMVGAYACGTSTIDMLIAVIFGLIAYIASKFGYSITPMLIGIVLGSICEQNVVKTIGVYGSLSVILTRPICLVFLAISVVFIVIGVRNTYRKGAK
ncbi:MAG: tripartite tricarboxylate transporter permease [Lachnospiraceae bacterium]|nr:tripartite tricarboxylate transporter permease [Lachnospiraceae bacterium]